ncbi:hypothetical protein AMATHDRAFT_45724 [Amanita thiersii Skay4041]|uniref:Peptidase A1 domain-containing protein n=1 Tax=Amanita thiersii Skay4041 TaxID=703135 RepID=A0A2A9NUP6_9AGAR|nr:hypothetical protein AMATHDRAFT_45724 [Amanita thiersii Skay4041]
MYFAWKVHFILAIHVLVIAHAEARPTSFSRRISVPLRKVHLRDVTQDVHPVIVHQQHVNRGTQRLARMTGREEPSNDELNKKIADRLSRLSSHPSKRFYLGGIPDTLDFLKLGHETHNSPSNPAMPVNAFKADTDKAVKDGVTPGRPLDYPNSIPLDTLAQDYGYLGTVYMGTPPRPFSLLMDSGSADLWVGSEECRSNEGGSCGNHVFLGPNLSSTYRDTNRTWSISYRTGAVSGRIVQDTVTVAGLHLENMTFGVALNETSEFTPDYIPFDGLVGLAKSQIISRQGTPTLVEALHKAGLIPEAITSYKIPRLADGKNDGELTFGGMDPSKYNANTLITVKNKSRLGFWEAAIDSISVNGVNMGWSNRTAILDTGTSLMVAPSKDVEAIHRAIPGAKYDGEKWIVPCTLKVSVSLTFGGREFAIDPRDIAFLPMNPDDPTGDCMSGISEGNVGPVDFEWLVGDVFLKNVYFSTNVDKDEISLAKLAP